MVTKIVQILFPFSLYGNVGFLWEGNIFKNKNIELPLDLKP